MSQIPYGGQAAMQNSLNLCDYCHIKPKFGQFTYCSKTCAAQAPSKPGALGVNTKNAKPRVSPPNTNLCDYCKKAPKHPGHDYCGKSCGQNAKTGSSAQPVSKAAQNSSSTTSKTNPNKASFNAVAQATAAALTGAHGPIDPTQIANLVVQQLQTLLPSAQAPAASNVSRTGGAVPVATTQAFQSALNTGSSLASQPSFPVQTQPQLQTEELAECLIPGCGQPVYVDAKGLKTSAYCSMRHRQEAVDSGLASPCIFCLELPQSDTDYFCSQECREESLNKDRNHDFVEV